LKGVFDSRCSRPKRVKKVKLFIVYTIKENKGSRGIAPFI